MATYEERKLKIGKITYGVQINIKDLVTGKPKFYNTTWKNPDNLTGVRAERAAHAFGEVWEKELRSNALVKPVSTATFLDVANEWLAARKDNMSKSYYLRATDIVSRLNVFFNGKVFKEITARDVKRVFVALNEYEFESVTATLKDGAKDVFSAAALAYGARKADRDGVVARPVLYAVRRGEPVQWYTAKAMCTAFGVDINECFDKTHKVSKYRSESIMKYKRILSCIYNNAIADEIVTKNYASHAYLGKVIGGEMAREVEILSEKELKNLLAVLDKEPIMQTMPVYLLATLGLRTCEAAGLNFEDIDWERRVLSIKRDRLYLPHEGIVENTTKTKYSKRDLAIPEVLYNKLRECKELYDKIGKNDPKFRHSDAVLFKYDGTPANPQNISHILGRMLVKADCRHVSPHKLRHTLISIMVAKGVPVSTVSKIAGHADCEITLKVYTKYMKDTDNSKEVLDNLFGKGA